MVLVQFASVRLSWLLSFASKEARPELREREEAVKEQALRAGGRVANHPLRYEARADRG